MAMWGDPGLTHLGRPWRCEVTLASLTLVDHGDGAPDVWHSEDGGQQTVVQQLVAAKSAH